ncbi:hypothetical protein A28LD_0818 [Idiomarina sp. A28L]|uniref:RDD family protein n=1 Tax=Idiomarina sp. A28L TaxID=1036674 RepID=UPI0002138903|nr:RDD family protein [Idiomarina sp. A28L]EGN75768.1 hypothetical protein A28LD_0818 [Idiomarina sp. A28L]
MSNVFTEKWISGFWRRVGALIVDTVVLGMFGALLGWLFADAFIAMGPHAFWIGLVVALLYFGVLNSSIGNGQTIGKRLFAIRVVDASNAQISLFRSLGRYSILVIPYSLSDLTQLATPNPSIMLYVSSFIGVGGSLAIVYLVLFNRATRQSLHDIATGTYVVYVDAQPQPIKQIWRGHFIVVAIFFIFAAFAPIFTSSLAEKEPFKELFSLRMAVIQLEEVSDATVSINYTAFGEGDSRVWQNVIVIEAFVESAEAASDGLAYHIASITHANYSEAEGIQEYRVTLTHGYDIGIWSYWDSRSLVYTQEELIEGK